MDLKQMYNQELQQKQQDALDEAAARAHLGGLIGNNISVKARYDSTIKLAAGADAEKVLKQAVQLVKPAVWTEDGYSVTDFSKRVYTPKVKSGLRSVDDKKHRGLRIDINQTFIHQYHWHDQSMHLYEYNYHQLSRTVPKKVLGNYESEFKMMISEVDEELKMVEKLARGSQKYVKIRYRLAADDCAQWIYLFSDGNAYIPRGEGGHFWFHNAFEDNKIEETSRFIVKQIMALNEK